MIRDIRAVYDTRFRDRDSFRRDSSPTLCRVIGSVPSYRVRTPSPPHNRVNRTRTILYSIIVVSLLYVCMSRVVLNTIVTYNNNSSDGLTTTTCAFITAKKKPPGLTDARVHVTYTRIPDTYVSIINMVHANEVRRPTTLCYYEYRFRGAHYF